MKLTVLPHPAKPIYGTPCNGCGQCCMGELCPPAKDFWPGRKGPCPALEYESNRFWCGLIRRPSFYTNTQPDRKEDQIVIEYFTKGVGAGWGCDALTTPEDREVLFRMAFDEDPERREYAREVLMIMMTGRI
jgi:hypothetical protein